MGMFIERLLNQGNAPLLEQMLKFTAARHRLIAENIVNVDTPGYRQKDLSLDKFQAHAPRADRPAAPTPARAAVGVRRHRRRGRDADAAASCFTTATTARWNNS